MLPAHNYTVKVLKQLNFFLEYNVGLTQEYAHTALLSGL